MRKASLSLIVMLIFTACSSSSTVKTPPNAANAEIVTITSTSSTTALITFNQEMAESAANKDNYEITNQTDGGQITKLSVVAATLSEDAKQVTLTTLTQAQVSYSVKISNVTSKDEKVLDTSKNNTFVGTAGTGSGADTDGDGLSDAQEQQGWTITIKDGDNNVSSYLETSDPNIADTDEDGVNDGEEFAKSTDPRKEDTDSDGITDQKELNVFNTDASNRDHDKDGLSDGDEINKYKTSPLLEDTDADQLNDKFEVDTATRDPRIADLPEPLIEVENLGLSLAITLEETKDSVTTELESKTATVNFSETSMISSGTTDSQTDGWHAQVGASAKVGAEFEGPIPTVSVEKEFSAEAGLSGSSTYSIDKSASETAQEAYEDAVTTTKEISQGSTFSKEINEGYVSAQVKISNLSDVAFTIKNLQIFASMQSPTNPTQFEDMATLDFRKTGINQTFEVSVGPNQTTPITYLFEDSGAFPNVVEQLMKNPTSVAFTVSGYDLVDESGRNFAYVQQELNDNTAKFFIDYGVAAPFERNRISTFDAVNNSGGITIAEALESVLGLTHYDENLTASSSLSVAERKSSYSTRLIDGVETLWRVRDVARDSLVNPLKEWVVITRTGIDKSQNLTDYVLAAGSEATLSFAQDKDKDGVIARIEASRGSSDEDTDSDDDGLSDREEIYEGWTIEVVKESGAAATPRQQQVFSNPARADSDNDGLTDTEEKALRTDPADPDTDGDRIFDKKEVDGGYQISLLDNTVVTISKSPTLGYATNPLDADTDNDSVKDGDELDYKVNPQVADADLFTDTDGDGLSDRQEKEGWLVTSYATSFESGVQGRRSQLRVFSDPEKANSDSDGLNDLQEFQKGTNPNLADTDGDGYNDDDAKDPNPLDADSDNDGLNDFFEKETGWPVFVDGARIGTKKSDPTQLDTDGDRLNDYLEWVYKADPREQDTDGDDANDLTEYERIWDGNTSNITSMITKDQVITVEYKKIIIQDDCDPGSNNGEWNWNLYVVLPAETATTWMHDEPGGEYEVDESEDIDISGSNNKSGTGQNPITFVKKYTEQFHLEGHVYEIDSGEDEDSTHEFDELTTGALYTGKVRSAPFKFEKGSSSCNSIVQGSITAE